MHMLTIPTLPVQVTVKYVGRLKNGQMIHRCSDYTFKLGKTSLTFVPSSDLLHPHNTVLLPATGAKELIAGWDLGILGHHS